MLWYLVAPVLLALLIVVRLIYTPFLHEGPFESTRWLAWISWFGILATILAAISSYSLAPRLLLVTYRILGVFVRWGVFPLALLVFAAAAIALSVDFIVNNILDPIFPAELHTNVLGWLGTLGDRLVYSETTA